MMKCIRRKTQLYFLTIMMIALCQGCSVTPPVNHVLSINKFGDAVYPGTQDVLNENRLDAHFDDLLTTDKNEIVLYIHGGLNIPSKADKRAKRLVDPMQESDVHPVFIHWRSGLATTYFEHAFNHRQGEYWSFFPGLVTAPFIFLSDVGRSIARTPIYWFYKFNTATKAIFPFVYPSEKNALAVESSAAVKMESGFAEIPSLVSDKELIPLIERSAFNVVQFALSLPTAPLFDLFGTSSWGVMKRRAGLLFTKTRPMDGELQDDLDSYQQQREGALSRFMDELKIKQMNNPALEVTIVGHSMGAIVANRILRGWPDVKFKNIIYMGAASTIDDFRESVTPYMLADNDKTTKFFNLMLHPVAENSEAHGFGFGGTGSLLTQIDDLYQSPVLDSGRTMGRWVNIMNGLNYFDKRIRNRVHLRVMPLNECFPTRHGDFAESRFIETSGAFWKGKLGAEPESCL